MNRRVPVMEGRNLTAGYLRSIRTKSLRNGNWWRLSHLERALFKSTIGLASLRGLICNHRLLKALTELIRRLLETPSDKIIKLGYARAEQLIMNLTEKGMTTWVSLVAGNLSNRDFVFCLGLCWMNAATAGVRI